MIKVTFTTYPPPLPKNERLREFVQYKMATDFMVGMVVGALIVILSTIGKL